MANEPRFAAVPPACIVPMLADEGVYLASESTFSRVLRDEGQAAHRVRAKKPRAVRPPTTHVATAPRQVWCRDMICLPATVVGVWLHLYLILDLYSRKIVGWEVHATDDCVHAAHPVRRTALAEGIATMLTKPVLHGDNDATDLEAGRTWAAEFVRWYNDDHRHGGIRYVTPGQRHEGEDHAILAARHALFTQARQRNPARWSGNTRDWSHIRVVALNPERDTAVNMPDSAQHTQQKAA